MNFIEYNKIHFHLAKKQFEENHTRFAFVVGFSERDKALDICMDKNGTDLFHARKLLLKALQLINEKLDN